MTLIRHGAVSTFEYTDRELDIVSFFIEEAQMYGLNEYNLGEIVNYIRSCSDSIH